MKAREWIAYVVLGLAWGSSFLWIKIALREVGPFTLVAWRLLFGVIGMLLVLAVVRPSFPRRASDWLSLTVLGLTNSALPFTLISLGQQTVDSAEVSILTGTVPLFTLIVSHMFDRQERITPSCVVGLMAGFLGVIALMGRGLDPGSQSGSLMGRLAVLAAMVAYAGSAVFASSRLGGTHLIVQAFVPLVVADAVVWLAAASAEAPLMMPQESRTWMALLWLGLVGSCLAYLLYFYLLPRIGPTRTNMVTYLFPLVGVTLGVVFLQEVVDLYLVVGGLLVLSGIAIVNWGIRPELFKSD